MLVVMFAPFILIGTLLPRPQFNMVTMLVAVNTATFISIQGAYAGFLRVPEQQPRGCRRVVVRLCMRTRPFGANSRCGACCARAGVARSASTQPLDDQHASRMLDRVTQLLPRLGASDDHRHPSIESFRDLRIALDASRRCRRSGDVPDAIDRVLAASPITTNAARRERQPAPPALLATIDDALQRVAGRTCRAPRPTTARRPPRPPRRRTGHARHASPARHAHALVGLRLSLSGAGSAAGAGRSTRMIPLSHPSFRPRP